MPPGSDSTPPGVEKVNWDTISSEDRVSLELAWKERDQRVCQGCGVGDREAHLSTCAACGNNRIRRIFYCVSWVICAVDIREVLLTCFLIQGRDCQKLDWENHKNVCKGDHEGPVRFGVPAGKSHRSELHREREIWRWLEAMRDAIVRIFLYNYLSFSHIFLQRRGPPGRQFEPRPLTRMTYHVSISDSSRCQAKPLTHPTTWLEYITAL
jgi:hypothetical protein